MSDSAGGSLLSAAFCYTPMTELPWYGGLFLFHRCDLCEDIRAVPEMQKKDVRKEKRPIQHFATFSVPAIKVLAQRDGSRERSPYSETAVRTALSERECLDSGCLLRDPYVLCT